MRTSRTAAIPRGRTRPSPHLDNQHFQATRGKLIPTRTAKGWKYVDVPREGYWKTATCEEFNCNKWRWGFKITLNMSPMQAPEDVQFNQSRAYYIRKQSGRECTETWEGSSVTFHFPAGTKCFPKGGEHKLPVHRDPIFVHRSGLHLPWRQMEYGQYFESYNETAHQLNRRQQDG